MLSLSTQDSSRDISQIPGGFLVLTEFPGGEPEFPGGEITGSHPVYNASDMVKSSLSLPNVLHQVTPKQ